MTREEAVWYVNHTFEIIKEELCNSGRFDEAKEFEIAQNMAIEALSAEAEWIPCSEKLPNYREAVLVSTFWGVRMAERDSVKEDGTDDFWYLFLDDATARPMYVYAWMPLPEPYKGGGEK